MNKIFLTLLICLAVLNVFVTAASYSSVSSYYWKRQPLKEVIRFGANRVLEELQADGDISDSDDYSLDHVINVWKKQDSNYRWVYKIRAKFNWDGDNGNSYSSNNDYDSGSSNDYDSGYSSGGSSYGGSNSRYLAGYSNGGGSSSYGGSNNDYGDDNNDNYNSNDNDYDSGNAYDSGDESDTDNDFEITYVVRHNSRTGGNNLLQHYDLVWEGGKSEYGASSSSPSYDTSNSAPSYDTGNAASSNDMESMDMESKPSTTASTAAKPASTASTAAKPASTASTGSSSSSSAPSSASVNLGDNFFSPKTVTVRVGGTVTWHWGGNNDHNVTFDDGVHSVTQSSGSYSRTFSSAGTYKYHCTIHGLIMSGEVIVE